MIVTLPRMDVDMCRGATPCGHLRRVKALIAGALSVAAVVRARRGEKDPTEVLAVECKRFQFSKLGLLGSARRDYSGRVISKGSVQGSD